MQVNGTGATGVSRAVLQQPDLLLPDFTALLQPTAQQRDRRVQATEQQQEKSRRKQAQRQDAAANGLAPDQLHEQMRQTERREALGSRSTRPAHAEQHPARRGSTPSSGFRQVLAATTQQTEQPSAAAPRESAGTAKSSSAAASKSSEPPKPQTPALPRPAATANTPHFTPPTNVNGLRMTPADASATKTSAASAVAKSLSSVAAPRGALTPAALAEAKSVIKAADKAPAPTAPAATEPDGEIDANVERIVRLIHSRLGPDRSVATLRLDPPELGTVRLHMDLRADGLSLAIETQTPEAQQLLTDELDSLQRSLAATGVRLEHVEVRTTPSAAPGGDGSQPQHAGAWTGNPQHSARDDERTARSGTWRAPGSPKATASAAVTGSSMEPVTESLVNVLA